MCKKVNIDKQVLIDLYVNQNMSARAISFKLNVSDSTVRSNLIRNSIPLRKKIKVVKKPKIEPVAPTDILVHKYTVEGCGIELLSKEYNISSNKLRSLLESNGVTLRVAPQQISINKDELETLYVQEQRTLTYIARKYKVSIDVIKRRLVHYGIALRIPKPRVAKKQIAKPKVVLPVSKQELFDLYVTQMNTMVYIANHYNVSRDIIRTLLKKYNIPIRPKVIKITKAKLVELYVNQKQTMGAIAKILGTSLSTIGYKLRKFNIPIRDAQLGGPSAGENELLEYIQTLVPLVQIQQSNKTILDGKEIDIYIPSMNIGFEYNGIFHHSDRFCEPGYHQHKTTLAHKNNVRLVHIFSDEWANDTERTKLKISEILVPSIVVPSIDITQTSEGRFELQSFNDTNLVSEFIRDNDPTSIEYIADHRWDPLSESKLEKIGFKPTETILPSYEYVFNRVRVAKEDFNEVDHISERLYKIYHCSSTKYIWCKG